MLILGLTGGIATGKSTVSNILSQAPYNIPIIDADIIARHVVNPGTRAYYKIIEHFGPIIPDLLTESSSQSGTSQNHSHSLNDGPKCTENSMAPLNRMALARTIFGNTKESRENRAILNRIVHPEVRLEIIKEVLKKYICGYWMVILDVPLLFESQLDLLCGAVLLVTVRDVNVQMRRLQNRDIHLSSADAEARIQSQADLSAKVRKCLNRGKENGMIIYNDSDIQELNREVERVISQIKRSHPQWWTYLLWIFPPFACCVGFWHLGRSWLLNRQWKLQEDHTKAVI
ncbi:hypothetical protein HI914_05096 [Erysiphe necator]|nr:hypothetical protein HI914_05096 [Erysiphe necator]